MRDNCPPTMETVTCLLQHHLLKINVVQEQLDVWMNDDTTTELLEDL